MKVHCKRDWKGHIDIRSHIAEKAIKENKNIIVTCGGLEGEKILTPDDLKQKIVRKQGPYQSKFEGQYYLHVYKWNEL